MCRARASACSKRRQPVAIAGTAIAFGRAHGAVNDLPCVLLYPCVGLPAFVTGVAVLASAAIAAGG